MEKLLTIVVPVYKVEKYINKCLESLVVSEDLMKLIEIIVVNDGTPDKSAIMAKEFEKRYPQTFHIIDKENGGHGSAFNKGVELATGKYIRFLDSDDWFNTDQFTEFLKKILDCNTDLVFTNMNYYYVNDKKFVKEPIVSMEADRIYDANKYDWLNSNNWYGFTIFHCCTYKTEILKKNHPVFLEKIFYDDGILLVLPIAEANDFIFYDLTIYNYLIGREGQTVNTSATNTHLYDHILVAKSMIKYMYDHPTVSESKKVFLDKIIDKICITRFEKLNSLPYQECKDKMADYMIFLNRYLPEKKNTYMMTLYENLPFCLYWFALKSKKRLGKIKRAILN